jgi:hypothetical protein
MTDIQKMVITFDFVNPYESAIEIDGHKCTNVYSVAVVQTGPLETPVVELRTFGNRVNYPPKKPRLFFFPTCPMCDYIAPREEL